MSPAESEPLLTSPPAGRARAFASCVIAAALVFQVVVPLLYYVGDDPYDERFSWRMFSAVRVQDCRVTARETDGSGTRPVDLSRILHPGWITTLRRSRAAVARSYVEWRCEQPGVVSAEVRTGCRAPSGREVPPRAWSLRCGVGSGIEGP